MLPIGIVGIVAAMLILTDGSSASQSSRPQRRSPHGLVMKAGPAFSWLKKLDGAELVAINERCQYVSAIRGRRANVSVAYHTPLDRINGGHLASVGQFPYAAALGGSYTYITLCGATLISPRHLLTAAHCVRSNLSREDMGINQTVWLGGVCYYRSPEDNCPVPDMFQGEMELVIKVYYSYSARDKRTWDEKIEAEPADLALIQLRVPVDRRFFESGRVDFACLPPPPSTPLPQLLYNIGWGDHSDAAGSDHDSAHLRFVRLLTQPREEWSSEMQNLKGCQMSRASPRFCQYPPGRDEATANSGDSGSGAVAKRGDDGALANADVIYAVLSTGFEHSYSVNESDWREPSVERTLGDDVAVQYHLDELCYYLHLGCGVGGVTGVGTTLRLSSFYLKRKRSQMPTIAPFTLLSDEEALIGHTTPEQAIAAMVDVDSGGKGAPICLAVAISSNHLVTSRKCIVERYLRVWKAQKNRKTGGGNHTRTQSLGIASANSSTKDVEFIAWHRAIAGAIQDQKASGSDLVIIQLARAKMFSNQ